MTNPNTVDDSCLQPERVQLLSDAENAFGVLKELHAEQPERSQLLSDAEDTFRVLKELYAEQLKGVMALGGDESQRRRAGLSDKDISFIEDMKNDLLSFFEYNDIVSDGYLEAIVLYSQRINHDEARARALGQLEDLAQRAYYTEYLRSVQEIKRIFPDNIAEVNVPKECETRVPGIRVWQRKTGIKVAEQANLAYMGLATEARRGVERDVKLIDDVYVLQDPDLVMPDDKMDGTLRELVALLIAYKDQRVAINAKVGNADNSEQWRLTLERYASMMDEINNLDRLHGEKLDKRTTTTIDELTSRYVQSIVSANKNEVVDSARRAARGRFISIVEEYLDMLKFSLDNYTAVPDLAVISLEADTKRKRKHRAEDSAERNDEVSKQVREVLFKHGDELFVESDLFPWLGGEIIRPVLMTYIGINGGVAVLDMRTPDVTAIEHKMAGYKSAERRSGLLPIIEEKLQKIARAMADGDQTLSSLKHLKHRNDTDKYPLPISYWGNITSNATRVYVSRLNVANMPESEMKQELSKKNVDELLLFIGACDKQHQEELLKRFCWG